MSAVRIGLIGFGHWGPNHVRIFQGSPECSVRMIVDRDPERLNAARRQFSGVETASHHDTMLNCPEVDAVIVSTPVSSHYSLVKAALLAGKDVLVEKPITYTSIEAEELMSVAEERGRVLMCGHVFLFNAGIQKLRQYVSEGILGRIYYMAATRTNLGPLRRDVNALYDLGSHDVSIFHYLLNSRPRDAVAWGACYLQHDQEDVTFACLEYPNQTLCHVHISWLNPRKERTLVVVGDKKMAVWDDVQTLEPIRLYDKGLSQEPFYDSFGQFQLVLRDADILIPKLVSEEPLKLQDEHFLECVRCRQRPVSDGAFARDVVLALEALQRSLRRGGSRQRVADAGEKQVPGGDSWVS